MQEVVRAITEFMQERGWDTPEPANVAKSIVIEAAELLEVFQWDHLSVEDIKKDPDKMKRIEKETADVLIYAVSMAILFGFDPAEAVRNKLATLAQKYPADLMKKEVNPGRTELYWQIKEQHRQES